jgi:hypothetical protein
MPAGDDVAQLLARLDALERKLGGDGGSGAGPGRGGEGTRPSIPERTPPPRTPPRSGSRTEPMPSSSLASFEASSPHPVVAPTALGVDDAEADASLVELEPPIDLAVAHIDGPPASDSPEESAPLALVLDRLRGFLQSENRGLAAALEGGQLLERSADRLRIAVPGSFAATRLQSRLAPLEEICGRFFGRRLRIEITQSDESHANGRAHLEVDSELARKRRQEALQHPAVNAAMEILGGEIVEIRPLGVSR